MSAAALLLECEMMRILKRLETGSIRACSGNQYQHERDVERQVLPLPSGFWNLVLPAEHAGRGQRAIRSTTGSGAVTAKVPGTSSM